jgi:hypothetical protein
VQLSERCYKCSPPSWNIFFHGFVIHSLEDDRRIFEIFDVLCPVLRHEIDEITEALDAQVAQICLMTYLRYHVSFYLFADPTLTVYYIRKYEKHRGNFPGISERGGETAP